MDNDHYLSIREAADYLNVTPTTLRRWEANGRIMPHRTAGGQRRYTLEELDSVLNGNRDDTQRVTKPLVIGYCRVSTVSQKDDLTRQVAVVSHYCEVKGYQFRIIKDIGSGLNYHKKGLTELIRLVCAGGCSKIVLNYKDRLVRFGYELIETICSAHHVEIEVINQTEQTSYEQELVDDVLSIITVFSAKLYGRRSHKNKQIVSENRKLFTHETTG